MQAIHVKLHTVSPLLLNKIDKHVYIGQLNMLDELLRSDIEFYRVMKLNIMKINT